MHSNIEKYLTGYVEKEAQIVDDFPDIAVKHAVVIPAYKESPSFLHRFQDSRLTDEACLVVVVINQPDTDNCRQAQNELRNAAIGLGSPVWQKQNLTLVALTPSSSYLLLVDRFNQPLNAKQGVGHARKIGADLVVALYQRGIIKSNWLYSTDADAHLPDNYFSEESITHKQVVASYCQYFHVCDDKKVNAANQQYELGLNYFVAGLKYANSRFAYPTIGSIIAVKIEAYATVRGFPKKSAGEDFYLLNKLAKIGDIAARDEVVVKLDARPSNRVPFGTGPAVINILALQEAGQPYCYYSPQVFVELKQCLCILYSSYLNREQPQLLQQQFTDCSALALAEIGWEKFLSQHQNVSEAQYYKQISVWFDAFKTLKFIHSLRRQRYPDLPIQDAVAIAPFATPRLSSGC